jgi:DNA (cytosine-5)-methyltransferase 1
VTYASLFSGVEGAGLGLERAGFRNLWQCEIDRQASDVLRYHSDVPNYGDVTKLNPDEVEVPDVLWMSPPCQDLSVAGARAGLEGNRSGLFYDAVRIAGRLAARGTRFVLMEQVPGLFSSNEGRDFPEVLRQFLNVGARDISWAVLDAQWFGVPQRRRRIFLVVDFGGECAEQILFEPESLRGDSPPSREAGEGVAGCLSPGAHPGGFNGQDAYSGQLVPHLAGTIGAHKTGGWGNDLDNNGAFIPVCIAGNIIDRENSGAEGLGAQEDLSYTLTKNDVHAVAFTCKDSGQDCGETAPTLRAMPHDATHANGGGQVAVAYGLDAEMNGNHELINAMKSEGQGSIRNGAVAFSNRGKSGEAFETIRADCNGALPMVGHAMQVRRLVPRECEKLMAWPPDHTRYGKKPDGTVYEMADGPRYRCCGNGVVANCSEWIGRRVADVLRAELQEPA